MTVDAILQALREQGRSVDIVHVRDDVWSIVGQVDIQALTKALYARKQ